MRYENNSDALFYKLFNLGLAEVYSITIVAVVAFQLIASVGFYFDATILLSLILYQITFAIPGLYCIHSFMYQYVL